MSLSIPFTKMHGLGNDFVMLPSLSLGRVTLDLEKDKALLEKLAAFLCDRHFGIGADGLIIPAEPSDKERFDIRFVYLNSDGSWAEMCGNGIRCFARYVKDQGLIEKDNFRIETLAGLIQPTVHADQSVTVDMGAPILQPELIPFRADQSINAPVMNYVVTVLGQSIPVTPVSMGNPHCLVFQDDLPMPLDPTIYGPALETHAAFPAKTNVEFIEVLNRKHLKVTVWERGCGFTLACGTGACATAVGAILLNKTDHQVQLDLPGGPLQIEWNGNDQASVFMTGPASYVFEGTISLPESLGALLMAKQHP